MASRQVQKAFRKKMVFFIFTTRKERGQDGRGNLLVENLKSHQVSPLYDLQSSGQLSQLQLVSPNSYWTGHR